MIRPQYHLRDSLRGLLAWDVRRLIQLTEELPTFQLRLSEISEIDENHWFQRDIPTCRGVMEHSQLIKDADLSFPIIVDPSGRVMDGMHRVCKALMLGNETILTVQLNELPEPDFIGVPPKDLPYGA